MGFINEDIKIDFPVSKALQEQLDEAERLSQENNTEYFCVADIIDVIAKEGYVNGMYTKEQWERLISRYRMDG